MKNPEQRSLIISQLVLAAGLFIVFSPVIFSLDMMQWGYGIVVMGAFVALAGIISVMAFRPRAAAMKRIIGNDGILGRWKYGPGHKEKLNQEAREDVFIMRIAGSVLGGIFVVIGLVMFAIDPDENLMFLVMMCAVAFVIGGSAFLAAQRRAATIRLEQDEAIFDRIGVWYAGELTAWTPPFSKLLAVTMDERAPSTLFFVFLQLHGRMPHYHTVSLQVPVPYGNEEVAESLVRAYGKVPDDKVKRYLDELFESEEKEE